MKFNKNHGCTEECDQYHPKACFESMKTKTCRRSECKFFHISGTKKEDPNGGTHINSHSNGNKYIHTYN